MEPLIDSWMDTYDLLFHVPILELPRADGIRATDPTFQRAVDERLLVELDRRGLAPHRLDPSQRASWLDSVEETVWKRLRPAQLQLL